MRVRAHACTCMYSCVYTSMGVFAYSDIHVEIWELFYLVQCSVHLFANFPQTGVSWNQGMGASGWELAL